MEHGKDSINRLPNELLVSILSLLTITEAGRTSILSHRWEKLWKSFHGSSIIFDDYWKVELLPEEHSNCICRVNKILTSLNESSSLDDFTVRTYVSKDSICHIDKLVNYALENRVKRLELDMYPYKCRSLLPKPDKYKFPVKRIMKPHVLYRVSYLTSLCLNYVNVYGEIVEDFIRNCPFLEHISLNSSDKLKYFKVEGAATKLKSLKISDCRFLRTGVISAPNLVCYHYTGQKIGLHVENAPELLEVSIGMCMKGFVGSSLSTYFSQLTTLSMNIRDMSLLDFVCLKLYGIKHLILRVNGEFDKGFLPFISSMERTSPLLNRLTVELSSLSTCPQREIRRVCPSYHPCLKLVEIIGFAGCAIDVELVMHLVFNTTTLEKIVIDRHEPFPSGDSFEETAETLEVKQRALILLEAYLPPGIDFVVS